MFRPLTTIRLTSLRQIPVEAELNVVKKVTVTLQTLPGCRPLREICTTRNTTTRAQESYSRNYIWCQLGQVKVWHFNEPVDHFGCWHVTVFQEPFWKENSKNSFKLPRAFGCQPQISHCGAANFPKCALSSHHHFPTLDEPSKGIMPAT